MSGHVYWSARDLASSPIGNHHFLLIVFENRAAAELMKKTHELHFKSEAVGSKTTYYMTLGGFADGKKLVFEANEESDVKAVREWIDPEEHTAWYLPDLDLESHEINPLIIDSSDTKGAHLINKIVRAAKSYKNKSPVKYNLLDENCACWVNTLLKALGYPQSYRHEKGEFFGVDWGEEDEIDSSLFLD